MVYAQKESGGNPVLRTTPSLDYSNLFDKIFPEQAQKVKQEWCKFAKKEGLSAKQFQNLLPTMDVVLSIKGSGKRDALYALKALMERKDFQMGDLFHFNSITNTISDKTQKTDTNISFIALKRFSQNKSFQPEMLSKMNNVLEKTNGAEIKRLIFSFNEFLEAKKIDAEKLFDKFVSLTSQILRKTKKGQTDWAFTAFTDLIGEKNFDSSIFDTADFMVEKTNNVVTTIYSLQKLIKHNPESLETIKNFQKRYEEARDFAKSLGASHEDLNVCLNFAYAIEMIGKEKTRELFKKSGIEFFARYSKKTLEEVYANLDPAHAKDKPTLLISSAKFDWNGAFYEGGMELEQLAKYYRITLVETDLEGEFYSQTEDTHKKHGKIDTWIIIGHGKPDKIGLGSPAKGEKALLDMTDMKELLKIKGNFIKKPTVVFVACSTGAKGGIGEAVANVFDASYFAPKKSAPQAKFHLDKKGKINNVTYYGVESARR